MYKIDLTLQEKIGAIILSGIIYFLLAATILIGG